MTLRKPRISSKRVSTKSTIKVKAGQSLEPKSEHDLQKLCVAKLRAHNMICSCTDVFNAISFIKDIAGKAIYKQHMIRMGGSIGFPDLLIIHNKSVTFVEFKWKKGKKSPEQEVWTHFLESQDYEVLEWRTLEDCESWIAKHLVSSNIESESI